VENALRAFSTTPTTSGERRRREQAIVMGIRHALRLPQCNLREKCGKGKKTQKLL